MTELMYSLIFGSYGFTLLTTKFLYGRTENVAKKEDADRLEAKVDKIYEILIMKGEANRPE